jgi:hypothetical protein
MVFKARGMVLPESELEEMMREVCEWGGCIWCIRCVRGGCDMCVVCVHADKRLMCAHKYLGGFFFISPLFY